MALGWYNGWGPSERLRAARMQREAVADGTLARPTHCSICGSGRNIWFHDERYDRPLGGYAICRSCHMILHQRFTRPAPWLQLVERYRTDACWFFALSMDPESLRRPFSETYPNGLPPSHQDACEGASPS
jgi:hypothetical protein